MVALILLVLGVRGCVNARAERSMKDYVSDVSALVAASHGAFSAEMGFHSRSLANEWWDCLVSGTPPTMHHELLEASKHHMAAQRARRGIPSEARFDQPVISPQEAVHEALGLVAWPETGLAEITVAVIDSGVSAFHPTLSGKVRDGRDFGGLTDHAGQCDEVGHGTIIAGIIVMAHADFRCCVTMNEDASTYEVPDYILSRLQPTLNLGFPRREDELAILQYHLPFAAPQMLAMTVDFLQSAHQLNLEFSVRDGIHLLQYALKRLAQDSAHPIASSPPRNTAHVNMSIMTSLYHGIDPPNTVRLKFSMVVTRMMPAINRVGMIVSNTLEAVERLNHAGLPIPRYLLAWLSGELERLGGGASGR
jgi:subtilisin family serine protease